MHDDDRDDDRTEGLDDTVETETQVITDSRRVGDPVAPPAPAPVEETSFVTENERVRDLGDGRYDRDNVRVEQRRKRPVDPFAVALAIILVLLVAAGLVWWLATRDDGTQTVPAVEGQRVERAVSTLESDGFATELDRQASDEPAGTVVDQSPAAGEEADEGSTVTLLVSAGPEQVTVPNAVGLPEAAARQTLVAAGFEVTSNDVFAEREPGTVTAQRPVAGSELAPGGRVSLSVSRGPELVAVPNVVGMTRAEAEQALTDAGLEPDVDEVPSEEPAGTVVAQHPTSGEIRSGDAVRINVSTGPA